MLRAARTAEADETGSRVTPRKEAVAPRAEAGSGSSLKARATNGGASRDSSSGSEELRTAGSVKSRKASGGPAEPWSKRERESLAMGAREAAQFAPIVADLGLGMLLASEKRIRKPTERYVWSMSLFGTVYRVDR